VTGQPITLAVRAALDAARRALQDPASAHGPVETVVLALDAAGLLQSPETAAELARLRQERAALNDVVAGADQERGLLTARLAELAPLERLQVQDCEFGQHRQWFADTEAVVSCPWCEIARLQAGRGEVYRALQDGAELAEYATAPAAGAHCESVLRRQLPEAVSDWILRGDGSRVLDLVTHHGGQSSRTGLCVVPVQVYVAYDTAAPAVNA
jgi:hypothetical protein